MLGRDKRSAVLITSSIAAKCVFAGSQAYSATKSLISNFGESVHYELKKNVDVTVWEPGYVHSNIHVEAPPGFATLETPKAVSDILACLGKDRNTRGSLLFEFTPIFSTEIFATAFEKKMRQDHAKLQNLQDEKDKKRV